VGGEGPDAQRLVQALERPGAGRGQRSARVVGQRLLDVLRLSALAVGRAIGKEITPREGSTDSNYPMSLGIPAITVGGGG